MTLLKSSILIVDDEPLLRRALQATLSALGLDITECASGEEAVRVIADRNLDVVLLDVNMAGMGGIEACRRIREIRPRLQILMLTVRDDEEDKIRALDAGADDYITKPFSVPELTARIRAAVRRATTGQPDVNKPIVIGEVHLDPVHRTVRKGSDELRFTPREFDLLHYFMAHAGVPITHTRLLQAIWGPEYGGELEYLRTFVHHLRKKIETDPASPRYLITEPYFGYRFCDPQDGRDEAKAAEL